MSLYEDIVTLMESKDDAESALPSMVVERLLDRRLGELVTLRNYVDEERVTRFLIEEFRVFRDRTEFRNEVRDLFRESLDGKDLARAELRSLLPDVFLESLNDFVTRNYRADPELVESLVDHPAMRTVMRNVLEETLREFVHRVTNWIKESDTVPGMSGAWSLFTGFFGMAHRYTKRFASRLEERVQDQVDRFVEEMIDEVLNKLVQELCSEEVREDLAAWRGRVLNELLDRSLESYLEGLEGEDYRSDAGLNRLLETVLEDGDVHELLRGVVSSVVRLLEECKFQDVLKLAGVEDQVRTGGTQVVRSVFFGDLNTTNSSG